jgi:glycosyltransferase involved in cell wall biosynthesis
MRVLCVALPSMLPRVRVLAGSLHAHQPDWPLEVVLVGSAPAELGELAGGLRPVSVQSELDVDVRALMARHPPAELITLLIPRLLARRCAAGSEAWLHLPASCWVLGGLEPLARRLSEQHVLLLRRVGEDPPDDGLEPSRDQLLAAGRISPELIAVGASAPARRFLDWWIARLESVYGPLDGHPERVSSEDRVWLMRMLELAPARFSTGLLDQPEWNLSRWNLHEHQLAETERGVVVDGRWPLRLLDLPGFEPDHPYRLSADSTRARVSRVPLLGSLCSRYARELLDAGWRIAVPRLGIGGRLANGIVFDETMASLYAAASELGESFGDLASPAGSEAFTAWLREPVAPWETHGISRYVVHRVLRERHDVIEAFPDLYGSDSDRFADWWEASGRSELTVDPRLLAPAGANGGGPGRARGRTPRLRLRRPVRRPVPPPPVQRAGAPLSVRVTGYLGHVLGLGSAARGYVSALAAAEVPVSTATVALDHLKVPGHLASDYGRHLHEDIQAREEHAFELICVNADELPHVVEGLGEEYFQGRRIGVWGWETNMIPPRWQAAFALIDEIWVYSQFMAENIAAVAPVPVVALPPPVQPPRRNRPPLRLGVPGGFLFLFVFDYLSTIQRKNPVGLIEAFKRAFEPAEGPQLLIKTINAPLRPLAEEEVLWAVEGRPDIHVVDRSLSGEEKDAVMMACDCYVSLHRSEGFGLTMAEAMAIGKPVIGTGYSGNVDFMTEANSFLVDYAITKVGPGCEIYPPDGEWAEPDLGHAASLMRSVYEHPEEAARRGAQARQDVARQLSPAAAGAAMRRRLEELAGIRPLARAPG